MSLRDQVLEKLSKLVTSYQSTIVESLLRTDDEIDKFRGEIEELCEWVKCQPSSSSIDAVASGQAKSGLSDDLENFNITNAHASMVAEKADMEVEMEDESKADQVETEEEEKEEDKEQPVEKKARRQRTGQEILDEMYTHYQSETLPKELDPHPTLGDDHTLDDLRASLVARLAMDESSEEVLLKVKFRLGEVFNFIKRKLVQLRMKKVTVASWVKQNCPVGGLSYSKSYINQLIKFYKLANRNRKMLDCRVSLSVFVRNSKVLNDFLDVHPEYFDSWE